MTRIERYRRDVKALEDAFGKLDGQTIAIDLLELAEICPRNYNQVKSYQGLISFINRTKNATVNITSQMQNENKNTDTK